MKFASWHAIINKSATNYLKIEMVGYGRWSELAENATNLLTDHYINTNVTTHSTHTLKSNKQTQKYTRTRETIN